MKRTLSPWFAVVLALVACAALPATLPAQPWTFSPLTAVGVGPSGPASAMITVEPYCCPSTAIVVKASKPVGEKDFQWVNLGLTWPADRGVEAVEVCYQIKAAEKLATYISQTRLTDMTTPDTAHVALDDPTDRKDPGPTCYRVKAGFTPKGTVTLALKVVIANTGDEIRVGMVKVY